MDRAEARRVRVMLGDLYGKIMGLSRKAELLDDVHRKLAELDPDKALALLMRSEEFNQEVKETVRFGCFALALWGYYGFGSALLVDGPLPGVRGCRTQTGA
ncbi:MAG: hypothetical protein AB1609_17385 [Bacillota bacterium]